METKTAVTIKHCFLSLQVKLHLESDRKLVRHEHGEGFNSVTTFELVGDRLHVVCIIERLMLTQQPQPDFSYSAYR
jgi:hypothetical protein